ncbi:hypothetical protein ACSW8S_19710 (plasmid) [Clostridium perfringens]
MNNLEIQSMIHYCLSEINWGYVPKKFVYHNNRFFDTEQKTYSDNTKIKGILLGSSKRTSYTTSDSERTITAIQVYLTEKRTILLVKMTNKLVTIPNLPKESKLKDWCVSSSIQYEIFSEEKLTSFDFSKFKFEKPIREQLMENLLKKKDKLLKKADKLNNTIIRLSCKNV